MHKYLVLDIETDGREVRKRFCDPLEKEHKIIMIQGKPWYGAATYRYNREGIARDKPLQLTNYDLLIGHNLKFDLLYLWENEGLQDFISKGGVIWDTCLAEYLLEGQNRDLKYSLKEVAQRYGGELKDDLVQRYFDDGKLFSEIPEEISIPYGLQDVVATEYVYQKQLRRAQKLNMLEIMQVHMNHLLAVTDIEFNGLHVDTEVLHTKRLEQTTIVHDVRRDLEDYIFDGTDWPFDLISLDINSPSHLSAVLFGGVLKYDVEVDNPGKDGSLFYKTGKRAGEKRTKKSIAYIDMEGYGLSQHAEKTKKDGVFKTGTPILKNIDHPIAKMIIEYRKEFKLLSAYFDSLPDLINPYTGCVHSEYKLTQTITSRLSSRNPNLQNLSPLVLDCFNSRFPKGQLVELDFDQLEVCIAAEVFNDALLKTEVNHKVDIHLENAKNLFRKNNISKKERKLAKFLTFGLLYGQGAGAMSKVHDIPFDISKRFIDIFYNKYIDIRHAHKKLHSEVAHNEQEDTSFISSITNKRYHLKKYDNDGREPSYSPSEMKNYKIQGTASDVTAAAAGLVFRYLLPHRKYIRMVNEVHDAILLDVSYNCPKEVLKKVATLMTLSSKYLSKKLRKGIDIPLSISSSSGGTWGECK